MSVNSAAGLSPVRKDRVRIVGFMAKKEGLTDAEFFKYWHEVHGPIFTKLEIVKKNILKYEQHHYTNVFEQGATAMGFSLPNHHGIAVFEAESYEKILEVFTSEEYQKIGFVDEKNFLDRSKTVFFPGALITFIDSSKKD